MKTICSQYIVIFDGDKFRGFLDERIFRSMSSSLFAGCYNTFHPGQIIKIDFGLGLTTCVSTRAYFYQGPEWL